MGAPPSVWITPTADAPHLPRAMTPHLPNENISQDDKLDRWFLDPYQGPCEDVRIPAWLENEAEVSLVSASAARAGSWL